MTAGYDVTIAGRVLANSKSLADRPYKTRRFKLLFKKGPLFYACLNIRLFLYLLFAEVDIILSNDLDTLLAGKLVAKIRNIKLVYDSHELFPEVPELVNRPIIKSIWTFLEKRLIRKIDLRITVSPSIASYYKDLYGVSFAVIRNAGKFRALNEIKTATSEENKYTIIYQGALNIGRGIELAILSMNYLEDVQLIIAGTGDIEDELKEMASELTSQSRIIFTGRLSFDEMWEYTRMADLGLSLEEDLGLNYRFALPNKLFDYIQARIPVIVSDLPEMKSVTQHYRIGEILEHRAPDKLAALIKIMLKETIPSGKYKENLEKAAQELNWEKEGQKIAELMKLLN